MGVITVVAILISGFYWYLSLQQSNTSQTNQPLSKNQTNSNAVTLTSTVVDYRASFAIFTNGLKRTFTAAMYHNQSEEVYIESSNPSIVFVKKKRGDVE